MRRRPAFLAAGLAVAVLGAGMMIPACGGGGSSSAADTFIAQAENAEEREALRQARDDIDAEMRRIVAEKDEEIDRLREERKKLEALLREKGLEP